MVNFQVLIYWNETKVRDCRKNAWSVQFRAICKPEGVKLLECTRNFGETLISRINHSCRILLALVPFVPRVLPGVRNFMSIHRSNIHENPIYRFRHSPRKFILRRLRDTPYTRTLVQTSCVLRGENGRAGERGRERETRKMRIAEMDRCLESYVSAI